MKVMLMNERTSDPLAKYKALQRQYQQVKIVNLTEDENYAPQLPNEYVLYKLAGVRRRPAAMLDDLPFDKTYGMRYNATGELAVHNMGTEIATIQLLDWRKQTVRAVKYMANGRNWQFDLVGDGGEVLKRWLRDEQSRTTMIEMTLATNQKLRKIYNYDQNNTQPKSLSFFLADEVYSSETACFEKLFGQIFDATEIEIINYVQ